MSGLISFTMGYLIGCINPASWIGKKKNVDLKHEGTGNLGATNTALVLGKKAGYFVLIFDMIKSIFSYKMAKMLFARLPYAGLIAGIGVLLGHCFPVFMHFQGGKGLASFGGLVLAHDPLLFAILLTLGICAAFAMNYGVYLAVTATVLFPITSFLRRGDLTDLLLTAIAGGLILLMHGRNLRRAVTGEDPIRVRDGLKKIFGKKK
jgi:glycerol-3-phosphate acyltransferase PlsY